MLINELRNYIEDVEPVSDRIIAMSMKGTIPITSISANAPTAQAASADKRLLYQELKECSKKAAKKGVVYTLGDFNARVPTKLGEEDSILGPRLFDQDRITLDGQSDVPALVPSFDGVRPVTGRP